MVMDALAKHWWAVALRGVAAIVFGGLTFALPGVRLAALTLLFGAYAIAFGALLLGLSLWLRRWRAVDPRPSLNAFAGAAAPDTSRSSR
jgi:uncharacterized membrane protein HdeD (DUF308 family)